MKFCDQCGKRMEEDMVFCPDCGHSMSSQEDIDATVSAARVPESTPDIDSTVSVIGGYRLDNQADMPSAEQSTPAQQDLPENDVPRDPLDATVAEQNWQNYAQSATAAQQPEKKKSKLPLIIALVLVGALIIVGGGLAAVYFLIIAPATNGANDRNEETEVTTTTAADTTTTAAQAEDTTVFAEDTTKAPEATAETTAVTTKATDETKTTKKPQTTATTSTAPVATSMDDQIVGTWDTEMNVADFVNELINETIDVDVNLIDAEDSTLPIHVEFTDGGVMSLYVTGEDVGALVAAAIDENNILGSLISSSGIINDGRVDYAGFTCKTEDGKLYIASDDGAFDDGAYIPYTYDSVAKQIVLLTPVGLDETLQNAAISTETFPLVLEMTD